MAVTSADIERERARALPRPEPHVIVLFGATGDLARRKLIPGLFHLQQVGLMPEDYRIIGSTLEDLDDDAFREHARGALDEFCRMDVGGDDWEAFSARLAFAPGARRRAGGRASRAPSRRSGARPAGCTTCRCRRRRPGRSCARSARPGWPTRARVIMEKPFGTDLKSARELNDTRPRGVPRGPDLPHRPLPRQGSGAQHAHAAVRQRLPRAGVEPRAHRPRADRRARDALDRHARRVLRGRPAPTATWSSRTCCRCSRSWRWSRRRRSSRARSSTRSSRCSARCCRSTPATSCSGSTRATATSRASRPTRRSRRSSRRA